jgi:phage tail sheath protein FI
MNALGVGRAGDRDMPEFRSPGAYVQETSAASADIAAASTSRVAFLGSAEQGPVNEPIIVRSASDFKAKFGTSGSMVDAVELFFLNGGAEAVVVRLCKLDTCIASAVRGAKAPTMVASKVVWGTGKLSPVPRGSVDLAATEYPLDAACFTAGNGGIRVLDGTSFDLLYIPPYREGRDVDIGVLANAANYCLERKAMLIVDAPRGWSGGHDAESGIGNLKNALGSGVANAAMYFPRLRRRNGPDSVFTDMPPGAAVAGVIARTDAQRGVWKAPAGTGAEVRGIDGAAMSLSDADLDVLNNLAINGIRSIPGSAAVVWGARTLAGVSSEWKYVPVRRLALLIEGSLIQGLKWTVFEPNDERLWARVRLTAGEFLHRLFRQGAFQGTASKDAFFVKCDRETTTQADVSDGVLNLAVGFAPLRPAEFVVLHVQLQAERTT